MGKHAYIQGKWATAEVKDIRLREKRGTKNNVTET